MNFLKEFFTKKIIISLIIVFLASFLLGYVSMTMASYEEGWIGIGNSFWEALKPF